jgi:2-oxoglutaroyl-CoA hydrolase
MTDLEGFRIDIDTDRAVATITLDVPGKMNRVAIGARAQLARTFEELADDDRVRVIVLEGAGDDAFTAGGDIAGFMSVDPEWISHLHENVAAPERCAKPVIAALHGYCLGVGLELALACDFRIAADTTRIGLPEISLGMIPGSGGSQRITHMVGVGRAKDMLMRGRRLEAEEALAWGLVTEVVPRAALDERVAEVADDMAARPAIALRTLKRVINQAPNAPLSVGMELEGLAYGLLRSTEDFAEGVAAFTEKRKPTWKDA